MSEISLSRVSVIVPVLNAGPTWGEFQKGLAAQNLSPDQITIVDSESDDNTLALARAEGYRVISVRRGEFHHGRTRKEAANAVTEGDILVYLTQDAILSAPDSILQLIQPFQDEEVGACFGRQLPRVGAGPSEAHARLFNYPPQSRVRTLASREELGFKAIFSSNSFAAYRRQALQSVGGFPEHVIVSEETIVFAKLILTGWKTVYVAEALVLHSHSYSLGEEFRRYFDIGVLHTLEPWLLAEFGHVRGEGSRFVVSELRVLWPRYWYLIPVSLLRTFCKLAGYATGRRYRFFSKRNARLFSQQRNFWKAH